MQSSRYLRPGLVLLPLAVLAFAGCGTSSRSPSDIALAEENYRLKAEQDKLRQQLAMAKKGDATPAADLKNQLEQSEEKLSHAVRSYSQAQEETAKLQAEVEKARSENSALAAQLQELKNRAPVSATSGTAPMSLMTTVAAAPTASNSDAESNLATALRTYALVSTENDQLKTQRDQLATQKLALESQISALKGAMPLAAQAEGLREQLRQTQAQSAAFAEENERLRSQLSLNSGAGGVSAVHSNTITPMTVATVPDPTPTPTPTPSPSPAATTSEPKMHTVVAGDTLSKIALKYYGTASRWPEILAANRDTMKNENSLVAGRKIKIP